MIAFVLLCIGVQIAWNGLFVSVCMNSQLCDLQYSLSTLDEMLKMQVNPLVACLLLQQFEVRGSAD